MAHEVDFYDDEPAIVDALAAYVLEGWARHETVVLVATEAHRRDTDAALAAAGASPVAARAAGHYLTLDAAETLRTFVVDGVPEPEAFATQVGGLVEGALGRGRPVRVFGEMVVLLWQDGNVTGALAVESLWNALSVRLPFTLLCAYPTQVLGESWLSDLRRLCDLHSQLQPPTSYAGTVLSRDDPHGMQSRVFLPAPQSVPAVRRFVTGVLQTWDEEHQLAREGHGDAEGIISDTLLACSEMATNAVLHARSPFLLSLNRSDNGVLVAVEDAAGGSARRQASPPTALGGRGLAIVQSVADRWGCEPLAHGKVVWAEVAPHPTPVAGTRAL
ncbi:MEDS domain-containing protein [Pedococcus sp.]|uniref:MEDS domain-containing protein n=1 Tax=Pedococcus sp. TaxID=2860345 RepID=UPI002E1257F6|nr:MEDS domain-containing protein [Pedococcus sp.]